VEWRPRGARLIRQPLDDLGIVALGAAISRGDMPVAPQGLDGDEEVGGASAHVLVVGSRRLAGSYREGCAHIPMQGHGLLIEADDGTQCVKRLGVESESVLYGGDKGSAHPG